MKRDLSTICLILCLALCVSACAGAEAKVAMGRYIEYPVKLPTQGYLSFAQANGAIYYVDGSGETLYMSADLNNWEISKTGHDEQAVPAKGGVNGLAVAPDGTIYLSSGWAMRNEEGYQYIERIKDGKPQRVQLDQSLDTGVDRLTLCALPNGELLGLSDLEAYRFSADGATMKKYAVPGGESMAVYENEVAICSTRNSLITILDIESGQTLRLLPLPSGAIYGQNRISYDAKGALYYICNDGLYQVNAGSTLMTRIADGALMSIGKPSVAAQALLFDRNNDPVIAYSQNGAAMLIAYRYDENVETEPGTRLSVFTLYDSDTLRECANKFQLKYPDVMVDIIVALPDGAAITRDDAIRTLNTEMLAGKGPDVLVLDGLPIQSYIDKGVLMDISPAVKPMLDSGELFNNIAGAFGKDDKMHAVPTRFLIPSIWGDVDGLNTLSDMAAWAQINSNSLPFYAANVELLIGTFYLSCAPAWFSENGRLDEANIEAFLVALKTIRGDWTLDEISRKLGWDALSFMDMLSRIGDWNPYQALAMGQMWEEMQGLECMAMGEQRQLPFLLRGLGTTAFPNGAMAASVKGSFALLHGQAQGCFVPNLTLGVSKATKNGDIAQNFIAYALSEECQNTDQMEGFQVNVKSLDAAQTQGEASFGFGMRVVDWGSKWLDPEQQSKLRVMIEALKTPVLPDFTLYQMLVDESTPFFEGTLSASEAAANVCAKANAYLSE